jgi:hypothetical protein
MNSAIPTNQQSRLATGPSRSEHATDSQICDRFAADEQPSSDSLLLMHLLESVAERFAGRVELGMAPCGCSMCRSNRLTLSASRSSGTTAAVSRFPPPSRYVRRDRPSPLKGSSAPKGPSPSTLESLINAATASAGPQ